MSIFLFKYRQSISIFFTIVVFLLPLMFVQGATDGPNAGFGSGPNAGTGSGPNAGLGSGPNAGFTGNTVNPSDCQPGTLCNPLKFKTVCGLVTGLLKAVMVIGIPVAILFIVWAGFKFVLAQGNPGELTEARSNFLNVIIGIGIFVGASLIAAVIMNTLQQLGVTGISSCG
ncbi:MAG TPA: pilin [Candidatus Paceibacterota bacterium]|nr:pilin [Candidatus Paceibacterota bacterium]